MTDITVTGYVQAVTHKSILLDHDNGGEAWYSRQHTAIVSGYPIKGHRIRLSVPQWLYDKANGNQPAQAATSTGQAIPPDMLKRLLMLCHPDRHDNSKASNIATQWLLEQRGRAS